MDIVFFLNHDLFSEHKSTYIFIFIIYFYSALYSGASTTKCCVKKGNNTNFDREQKILNKLKYNKTQKSMEIYNFKIYLPSS